MMNETNDRRFVDHPAPSVGLFTMMLASICMVVAVVPVLSTIPREAMTAPDAVVLYVILALSLAVMCFYLWPLYTTFYIVDKTGITVKYGPWTRAVRWDEFRTVYWQKGMFITKIGWPSINPCVRLSNGLVLTRKTRRLGLYLTPNDPRAFIEKITLFAPELTKEMIL